ncbi:MAG: molybdate ABC transporter substrate-binding protein, partial [Candidatus Promineifilaceae bacterium]
MKVMPLLIMLLLLGLAACTTGSPAAGSPQELTVFAAASLTDAFNELGETFQEQNEEARVVFNFAGSSQLAAQLAEGAAADLFASANPTQMQNVVDSGRIAAGTEELFASNRLAVIVPADNPAGITALEDLA